MRLLVTAGPTHEYLDEVRYLANASSGRLGYAVAAAAAGRGHRVVLVSGPTALAAPRGVRRVGVVSAREMRRAVARFFARADAVVMAAAVADFRPRRRAPGKIKKARGAPRLELAANPDILAALGRRKGPRVLVGFALEARPDRAEARRKLREKNLDLVLLDTPRAVGGARADLIVILPKGPPRRWSGTKAALGRRIVREVEKALGRRRRMGNGACLAFPVQPTASPRQNR